jgi:hypothetical protein
MPNSGAAPAPKSEQREALIWLSFFGAWAAIQVLVLAIGATPLLEGGLIGTDGYMRLVRVELLHETGAWFDGRIPRSNAPYGDTLHWTRPFDLLLLAAAWPLTPFLGFEKALFWGGAFVSPLLLLATGTAMLWASKPLVDPENRPFVVLIFLAQLGVMAYSLPGRIDHHTLQMFLIALTVGLVARCCGVRPEVRLALPAGVVLGLGLWISAEFLLVTLLAMAAVWLAWLRHGRAGSRAALGFAAGFAGSLVLVLLVERPWAELLAEEYDRVSVVFLLVALLHLAFWGAVAWAERGGRLRIRTRVSLSVVAAVVGGAVVYGVYPKFFGGGMVDVDPEVARVFLSRIKELTPLVPVDLKSFGQFLFWLGAVAIAIPFAFAQAWRKRRADAGPTWAFFALALGLYFALSLRHVRFAPFAELLAVVPLACLVVALRQRVDGIANRTWRELTRSLATLAVIFGITGAGLWLGLRPAPGGGMVSAKSLLAAVPAGGEDCEIARIAAYLNRPQTFGERSRIIATHVDWGPELLYRTGHAVVAAPYHRNAPGILDIQRMFSAVDPATSEAIVEARGIELALLCPSPRERLFYAGEAEGATLYQRLLEGWTPSWLAPVALPDDLATSFRLFQVIR